MIKKYISISRQRPVPRYRPLMPRLAALPNHINDVDSGEPL
jgi:hypothetical protein